MKNKSNITRLYLLTEAALLSHPHGVVSADSPFVWAACPALCGATARHSCCTWSFLMTPSRAALPPQGAVAVGAAELALTVCPCSFCTRQSRLGDSFCGGRCCGTTAHLFAFVLNV